MPVYDPFIGYTTPMRRGDRGTKVRDLQHGLRDAARRLLQFEYGILDENGEFDQRTETAVRSFQADWRLPVNGVADADVQRALFMARSPLGRFKDLSLASNSAIQHIMETIGYIPDLGETPRPASSFRTSTSANEWMFFDETGGATEVTAYLHFPGGSSGVTLGPGYDMKERDPESVVKDLTAAGVDRAVATRIAHGAVGLEGKDAEVYATNYGKDCTTPLVYLDRTKQLALQSIYLPTYENKVKANVSVLLLQREFDALVSFAVNPTHHGLGSLAALLNSNQVSRALHFILDRIPAEGSTVRRGLMVRRRREVEWFIAGRYSI